MNVQADLKYTKDHEWIRLEGKQGTIGITDHAQEELGDIVYVELPAVGQQIQKSKSLGVVESVKAVSEILAPVNGKVVEVNSALNGKPEQINQDPYGKAWMVKMEVANPSDLDDLMNVEDYKKYVQEEKA
ncbi:MAG: glycine cleavage system protein GcvH [Deltaproteobacteria bacterium]|nr:glycine cleavage system protein GcvH [Deltaproteobacteria bacterium]